MACSVLSLDVMDVSGEEQLDVSHNVFKVPPRARVSRVARVVADVALTLRAAAAAGA